ncbi:MAG: DUF4249 domain-containing protein [Tannerella sp.]|jgi:hypothetical protein|nr:DUF4249 domain-containing protein [Tannerella sp.]
MQTISKLFLPVAAAALLLSCTSEIDIRVNPLSPCAVLNASLSEDSVITAHVSRTLNGVQPSGSLFINNASVEVFVNGGSRGIMQKEAAPGQYILPGCYPAAGDHVRMEVVTTDYEPLSAAVTLPPRPVILSVDTQTYRPETSVGRQVVNMQIRLKDPAGTKNYYMLYAAGYTTVKEENGIRTDNYPVSIVHNEERLLEEVVYEYGYDSNGAYYPISSYYLFTDEWIDGNEYTLKIALNMPANLPGNDPSVPVTNTCQVIVSALSESRYLYCRSKALQRKQQEDLFGSIGLREPIPTYTNVLNGYGLLSAKQSVVYEIKRQ